MYMSKIPDFSGGNAHTMANFILLSDGVAASLLTHAANIWIHFLLRLSKHFKPVHKHNVDFVFYYTIHTRHLFMQIIKAGYTVNMI